jgi:hypothetical protein
MTCDPSLLAAGPAWPVLDDRDRAALLAELLERLPGFLPEWRPGAGDPGRALLAAYARYLEILGEGLNRLPERSLLAFLDLFGTSLTTAQSARVPLVFTLLPTSPGDVQLPAQTSVAASLPPPAPSLLAQDADAAPPPPAFYTMQPVSLGRAPLVALRSVDPAADCMTDGSDGLQAGFTAFDDRTPVGHALHLGHATLFKLTGTAEIVLSVAFAEAARPGRLLVAAWDYLSADGWLPLQVTVDGTRRFTTDGEITLSKCCGPDSKEGVVNGVTSCWIRATLDTAQPFADIVTTASGAIETDVAAGWAAGDLLVVDGAVRGVVHSSAGTRVALQQPVHFDVGETVDVLGKPSAIVAKAPVTTVGVGTAYPFLDGDAVTADGATTAVVARVRPGVLDLATPLAGADPGGRFFLAATPPPLRPPELDGLGPLPEFLEVLARLGVSKSGLQADQASCDASPLDLGSPFLPFGPQPAPFATFHVACDEAFALPGAQVQLEFTLARAVEAAGQPVLAWEYFDGASWQPLGIVQDLLDATGSLTTGGIVRFDCPHDWVACAVNGSTRRWLRARLDGGDYGRPMQLQVTLDAAKHPVVTSTPATLAPPVVSRLRIAYTLFTGFRFPEACQACNDFVFADFGDQVRRGAGAFTPFVPLDDRAPALHFGYDGRPPAGLASTYVAIEGATGAPEATSPFAWDYRAADGWREFVVLDGTNGFTTSGMLRWVVPPDAVATPGFGGTLHRLRARLKAGERVAPTAFAAIRPNAVWAQQGETVQQLVIGDSDGRPGQGFAIRADRLPVLPGETIELREWTGRGDDWQTAVLDVPAADLRFDREPLTGVPLAIWVRWRERAVLHDAGPDERVYLLERTNGLLRFGDDRHGRVPPAGARVVASFATGGGAAGNVAAGTVTQLRSGVAYLQGVTNPVAASGGAACERLASVGARGPQRLRNRERSVSFEDYEWLAREASPDVARVRCLPLTGPDGRPMPGWVGLLAAPQGSDPLPRPTPEFTRRIRDFLARRCPATVAGRIQVCAPRYVQVGVVATVVPVDPAGAADVGQRVRDACDRFLHPLAGGADGQGWQFGEPLYLSMVAVLLEAIDGVDHCASLQLVVGERLAGDRVAVGPDGIVAAGPHDIDVAFAAPGARALVGAR